MTYGSYGKRSPRTLNICQKGQGFAWVIVLASYPSDFIYKSKGW